MRFVLEQEGERIHVHRRHDLVHVGSRNRRKADRAVADALHIGDRVAKLRIVEHLHFHRALGEQIHLFAEIGFGETCGMVERLNAGIFGDDLRLRRNAGCERQSHRGSEFKHCLLPDRYLFA
jgi:hypothetical protein